MKNPPAFPRKPLNKLEEEMECGGMTLRDYFAAKAMQTLIGDTTINSYDKIAVWAYEQADHMLKARDQ